MKRILGLTLRLDQLWRASAVLAFEFAPDKNGIELPWRLRAVGGENTGRDTAMALGLY